MMKLVNSGTSAMECHPKESVIEVAVKVISFFCISYRCTDKEHNAEYS